MTRANRETKPWFFHTFFVFLELIKTRLGSGLIGLSLFILMFLLSQSVRAQSFTFSGGISNDNGTAESGVTVTAKSGGSVVETVTTSTSGRYKLDLSYGKSYTIEISKPGFSKRFYNVDLSTVKEENVTGDDFASQDVKVFSEKQGLDMSSISNAPITSYTFNKKAGTMAKDNSQESVSNKAEQNIATLKEKPETAASTGVNKAELEKQLKDKIKLGDASMAAKDFEQAINDYEMAAIFAEKNRLDDKEVQDKLIQAEDQAKAKKLADLTEKQGNAEFAKLLDEAKKLQAKQDFVNAKAKLEEAKAKKPDNKEVDALLKTVGDAILQKEAEEKNNADFQTAMTEGNQLFEAKDYENAIKKYEDAKKLKPAEKDPQLKIVAAQGKWEEQKKDAQNLAAFDNLMTQANALKDTEKYDDAIKKYEEAQLLLKERTEPKAGIDYCKTKKKEAEDAAKNAADIAKRDADYTAAMTKADDLFKSEKYTEAIKEYEAALKLKPDEAQPKTQIDAANIKIKDLASAEEKKKQFEQLKKDGEKAFSAKQLAEAKDKFTQANSLIEGDSFVKQKLTEIETLEKQNAAALAKEDQYKDLMTRAETALTAESFQEAKDLFTQALGLKPGEQLPTQKLSFIEDKIKSQAADLAKKQQFDALVASATSKEGGKDLKGAIVELNKAYELIKDEQIKTKIDQLNADLKNAADAAIRKINYDAAIVKAEAAKSSKDWQNAITLFEEAQKIDPAQTYPSEQIDQAKLELAKLKDASDRLTSFNTGFEAAENLLKEKKYKEAETGFKEVLSFADAESDKKKTNDKIAELGKILDQIEGEARKEQAFNDKLTEAQNLEKEDKLKEALEKYREAKVLKPDAPAPTEKEIELTAIIAKREFEAAQKAKFDDLISQGDQLFVGAKFKEAINKFEEAKLIFPENKQPQTKIDEVNKKIQDLANDAKEQAYQKILSDADKMRVDGKLDEAIVLYNKALQERPGDLNPKDKINEIQAEIQEKKLQAEELANKRKQYAELLKQAAAEFDNKELKKSLNLYNDAAQLLPDEAEEATKKIEQINNLLATEEAERLAEEARLAEIKAITDNADLAFKEDKYEGALNLYKEAKIKAPTDDIIAQKIKITEDRIAEVEKSKFEKKVKDKLAEADKAFAVRKYDDATALYNELLEIQPDHKKATEQIALIVRIKTPSSEIADLPDFGTPSMFSIIEGEALLSQAERQKEYIRLKKLRDQLTEMDEKKLEQSTKELEQAREAWLKSKGIERNMEKDPALENVEEWIVEQIVKEKVASMSEKERIENILAYKELVDLQAQIRQLALNQAEGVSGSAANPHLNEDEIKDQLTQRTQNQDESKTDQLELLLQNEAFLHNLYNFHETDKEFSDALTTLNNIVLHSLFYDLRSTTPEQLEARQAYLENAVSLLNDYAADLNQRTEDTYAKLTTHQAYTKTIVENSAEVAKEDIEESYVNRQKTLEALREFGDLITEQNNNAIENRQQLRRDVVQVQTTHTDVYTAEMTRNYLRMHQQEQDLKKIFDFDSKDFELWENDIRNAYAELKEVNRLVVKENDRITEEKQKDAYKNIKDINALVYEKTVKEKETHNNQQEASKTVQEMDRSASDKQQANLDKAKKTIQENRALLDQLERKDFKFTDATANKLGEQFPEGVTEENFVTKDDDDIVVEVKTRRIVVVNGNGSVYMRYSNRYGVTYTKNGVAITEYQWVKDTQNAKLQKYKVN